MICLSILGYLLNKVSWVVGVFFKLRYIRIGGKYDLRFDFL